MATRASILLLLLISAGTGCIGAPPVIVWSDGDSGKINGEPFRLYNVDAPETGGVGAAIGAAQCEQERERGKAAEAFMVAFTEGKAVKIMDEFGDDGFGRRLVNLSVDGVDVAKAGADAGHLKPWPHEGSKKLAPRPVWCE